MLNRTNHVVGSAVNASDGPVGSLTAVFFDDVTWTIRYLVVDAGSWLSGREVLISPYSVRQPLQGGRVIDLALSREQVQHSPGVDTQQPVSRQHERQMLNYYGYPGYWDGSELWAMEQYPLPLTAEQMQANRARQRADDLAADVHLRSSVKVTGYDLRASDDSIGHVQDFVFDDESWEIRYLVVDTRNWWPGGRKVLVAKHWIDSVDWASQTVSVKLTREQVKASPEYDEGRLLLRTDEEALHAAYGRRGYWD